MNIILKIIINEEEGKFISYCPELEVDSFGNTVEEAKDNLLKAIDLYFKTANETGILRKILKQLKKERSTPKEIFRDFRENEYLTSTSLSPNRELCLTG